MGQTSHDQVERIFSEAIELDRPDRTAFLAEACDGDESLKAHILKLIDAHEATDSIALFPEDADTAGPSDGPAA